MLLLQEYWIHGILNKWECGCQRWCGNDTKRSIGPSKQPPTKRHRPGTHPANSSPFVRLQSAARKLFTALCSGHNEHVVPGKLYPGGSAPQPATRGRPHCQRHRSQWKSPAGHGGLCMSSAYAAYIFTKIRLAGVGRIQARTHSLFLRVTLLSVGSFSM